MILFHPGDVGVGVVGVVDQESLEEYRYRAVCEILGGSPIGELAVRYGTKPTTGKICEDWDVMLYRLGLTPAKV